MAASRKGVLKAFKQSNVSHYFGSSKDLIEQGFNFEIAIAYMFTLVEQSQRDALVYGAMKLHRLNGYLTRAAVNRLDITRRNFPEYFETVYGKRLGKDVLSKIEYAEKIRDRILHGKKPSEAEKRKAICDILAYFEAYRDRIREIAGFDLAGSMTGFTGRAASLDRKVTGWILKGMGLSS